MGHLPKGDKVAMFYVYFLKSQKNNDLYVGSTEDVGKRVSLHNTGKVKSTQFYRPWQLMGFEPYDTRSEAMKMERFFKTGQQKELLKVKYGAVAK